MLFWFVKGFEEKQTDAAAARLDSLETMKMAGQGRRDSWADMQQGVRQSGRGEGAAEGRELAGE